MMLPMPPEIFQGFAPGLLESAALHLGRIYGFDYFAMAPMQTACIASALHASGER